ncbi:MAG: RNA polymerase sigma factor [Lachnospiraceae bacterium]|nr:RNA polymerase sigma factor [Lachnospiraceae bacterium]
MDIAEQYDKIYRYCYFRLRDKQLAQDITQETFLRFYRQDMTLDNDKELPYLYTIAKNLCVDEFRRKSFVSIEDIEEEADFDKSEEWINNLAVKSAMKKLPQEEQELLFLRYVNEISVALICKTIGISRFSVYRRLSKALKKLKEELKKEGFPE